LFFNHFLMKKALNIFLIVAAFVAIFYSSSRDKDVNAKLLKRLVEIAVNGTSATTDFSYLDGLFTKIIVLDKTNQVVTTIEYSYLRGQLVSVTSLNNYIINYIPNSDGSIAYEKFSPNSEGEEVKIYHGVLFFENKNLSKDERTLDTAPSRVTATKNISFEYDSKKNPFYSILGYEKLLEHDDFISTNNSLITVVTNSSAQKDQIISSSNFYKSSFKYDEDGYPTEKILETVMPVNGNSDYLKSQYFY
jgi:hypothetical protein